MKLHLGCGEIYLKSYTNIDYPPTKHTVQTRSIADEYHDITKLRYPKESIEEVRLHHVFEHFNRSVYLALLASWWSWLKVGGILRIEVPDFDRTAKVVLSRFSSDKANRKALRHIFGAQEAPWAVHYEGWSVKRLSSLLSEFGFNVDKVSKNSYKGTYNVEVFASKKKISMGEKDFESAAKRFLSDYLVDDSSTEKRMLDTWIKTYRTQIKKSFAR